MPPPTLKWVNETTIRSSKQPPGRMLWEDVILGSIYGAKQRKDERYAIAQNNTIKARILKPIPPKSALVVKGEPANNKLEIFCWYNVFFLIYAKGEWVTF